MANNHVLILLSLYEGLSNTLLEAGAAGLACIASDRGGNSEVITHNETGLLVDPFTIKDIESAIKLLSDSDEKRKEFAMEHRKRVMTKFALDKSVKRTIQVLQDAIR